MSEMSKAARAAMKKKAEKLTTGDPNQKVDSSTWSPPEKLNTEAKTGMRPVSRRAFKKGGKVEGESVPVRADRSPRKAGGRSEATAYANAKINRNQKDANEEREGVKQIGGMNKGGRAKKFLGGPMMQPGGMLSAAPAMGDGGAGQQGMPMEDPRQSLVSKDRFKFGMGTSGSPYKKGGKVESFEGTKKDESQDKKLAKKHGMSMKSWEASKMDTKHDEQQSMKGLKKGGRAEGGKSPSPTELKSQYAAGAARSVKMGPEKTRDETMTALDKVQNATRLNEMGRKKGGRAGRKEGGGVFTGPGYPGKVPGVVAGGRTAHASGGKAGKGKTNVNIIIAAGQPGQNQNEGGMPPGGMPPKPPGGMPIAVPPPPAAGAPAPSIMPMPMPMPMAAPQSAGGPPPMGRKAGGRTFHSYKDMKAGAGSGEGRSEKTEIAEHKRMMRKDGGHVYPKMKFGAGSGEGRVEKTEKYGLTGSGKAR